ncbi:NAD(P)-dependent dehydrogenase (short-subunit alcohol dehydrogenase family) [Povalibacter uvarum]|uniref:NAD(P)-dependent dehydrogenase (Short-subunit alcohol dehydrogenase family) n=1 Tax=Povalibacter uvarum TaxID=732238 RepID=A0A841HUC6_9GAMM|nr:SDR family NAD(P)-dependent oxidoreductase [Povalibacter uvarum]MBB6095810.1 NAD(P)-dependent dehydrogenase (short-subunit alcohol dehydrogenase family) [Povalibacter uvarum]
MAIRFDNRVAIVTGAGNGLGREYALELARRGARVVVNDLGGARDGTGSSSSAAQAVVDEIVKLGGEAIASGCSVTDEAGVAAMVAEAKNKWGRIDILINNAGILRDKSFAKMTMADFRTVLEVHLMGSVICTKAVWDIMREQKYGRILMTTSGTGLYGNFGQSNYAAAKLALVGFMGSLGIEGAKSNVHVNTIAPAAATRMTEDILPPELLSKMGPEAVVATALYLVSEGAPNRATLAAGAGGVERAYITLTRGIQVTSEESTPETVAARFDAIGNREGELLLDNAMLQSAVAMGKI